METWDAAVVACAFAAWEKDFGSLGFKAVTIDLPQEFVAWLIEDGISLPCTAMPQQQLAEDSASDAASWSSSQSDDNTGAAPPCPEVLQRIEAAIQQLGGRVVPKLNWSCPKDATWMLPGNTLCCHSTGDVLLLLKSSDRIAHDICSAFGRGDAEAPEQHTLSQTLVLKKSYDLRPEREFRCFIRDDQLIGISQRDVTQHFPQLLGQEEELTEQALEFFEDHVQEKFALRSYTMDIYISSNGKVKLMDFNPVGGTTASLLFDWSELGYGSAADGKDARAEGLDFRIIRDPVAIRPSKAMYGVPYDMVNTEGTAMQDMLARMRMAPLADQAEADSSGTDTAKLIDQ